MARFVQADRNRRNLRSQIGKKKALVKIVKTEDVATS